MNTKTLFALLSTLIIGVSAVTAQTCEAISDSLETLADNCADFSRGGLCQNGESSPLSTIDSLSIETEALARLQANYADVDPAQYMSLAFIGVLNITNEAPALSEPLPLRVPVEVNVADSNANVRSEPDRSGNVVASLEDGTELTATAISDDGSWLRVQLPDQLAQPAWIFRDLIRSDYELGLLTIAAADAPLPEYPELTALQAFSFTSESPCAGVVAQSGQNRGQLVINGIDLQFNGATAFLQNLGDALLVNVLDGVVQVQVHDTTITGVPGTVVRVPLDDGRSLAAPEAPAPYDEQSLSTLAGEYLARPVTPPPAASEEEIQLALTTPISGDWEAVYFPTEFHALEGPHCGYGYVTGSFVWHVTVAVDGSSFSWSDMLAGTITAARTSPTTFAIVNQTSLEGETFQIQSPTHMTLTYDTNSTPGCTAITTITFTWLGPSTQADMISG